MTEDEAKTKWCPFSRTMYADNLNTGTFYAATVNRLSGGFDNPDLRCIGSECMAWRSTDNEYYPEQHSTLKVPQGGMPAGYCGLAGKP